MTVLEPVLETKPKTIEYPERDGQPMADNTKQFRWIMTIQGGLDALFANRADVFVAGDLLWYPVEGDNKTRAAPDALIVFGRPKGDRSAYLQWQENGVAPQVVFEVLSPGNTVPEMTRKFAFYDRYGAEEYYLYDPDHNELSGWIRTEGRLNTIESMNGWVSPKLGIRFDLSGEELKLIRPDGLPFETYTELAARAEQELRHAERERQRAEKLAAQLRALGVEPEA